MPYTFDNSGPANYSEAQRTFSPGQDWTREGAGTDIWATADEFHFAYKELTGAGAIIAKVESVENMDLWAKAGVMIRDTLEPDSANVAMLVTPGNGVRFQFRNNAGGITDRNFAEGVAAPLWVKLERTVGGLVRASYSADGSAWTMVGMGAISMKMPVYIGLALTSHEADLTCEAKFSSVSFPGTSVSPQWTDQDIGILSNEAEPMYITVGDGGGAEITVYHDNPDATLIDTLLLWRTSVMPAWS
jgi:regulation of enolase protein 1 (concanavalin A-like superfamily)